MVEFSSKGEAMDEWNENATPRIRSMQRLDSRCAGFAELRAGSFYRSDHYDMCHNVAIPNVIVNLFL